MSNKKFLVKVFARNEWDGNGDKVLVESHQTNDYNAWLHNHVRNKDARQFFILEHDIRVYDRATGEEVATFY